MPWLTIHAYVCEALKKDNIINEDKNNNDSLITYVVITLNNKKIKKKLKGKDSNISLKP